VGECRGVGEWATHPVLAMSFRQGSTATDGIAIDKRVDAGAASGGGGGGGGGGRTGHTQSRKIQVHLKTKQNQTKHWWNEM